MTTPRPWALRFAQRVMLWLIPVAVLWIAITPFYNRFLTQSAENLVRLTERPSVTRLQIKDTHYFVITRSDLPASQGFLDSVRVTDTHFPLLMLGAFFLAVPGIPWRRRLENLGWAVLIAIFFHIFSLFLWVKFIYATQLGDWSLENYGPLARNVWGLSKHLADLPFKLALPILLWAAFYFRELTGRPAPARTPRGKKKRRS
ncbi:MAG: hypothetical protein AAGC60_04350 [Acidobacteriota bacterium]